MSKRRLFWTFFHSLSPSYLVPFLPGARSRFFAARLPQRSRETIRRLPIGWKKRGLWCHLYTRGKDWVQEKGQSKAVARNTETSSALHVMLTPLGQVDSYLLQAKYLLITKLCNWTGFPCSVYIRRAFKGHTAGNTFRGFKLVLWMIANHYEKRTLTLLWMALH